MRFPTKKAPVIKVSFVVVSILIGILNLSRIVDDPSLLASTESNWEPRNEAITDVRTDATNLDSQKDAETSEPQNPPKIWPTLPRSMFLVDSRPTNNTRLLLDFVVAGFPKCGTTTGTLGTWFSSHPEIKVQKNEQYHYMGGIKPMVLSLLQNLPKESQIDPLKMKKGFRSPHFIQTEKAIKLLEEHFPDAKLLLSVRHPVKWFESYYNYRVEQNELSILKGTPNELIGELKCKGCRRHFVLSTAKGRFHRYIARLHKTPLTDADEMQWLESSNHQQEKPRLEKTMKKMNNPVFFLEMSQLADANETRSKLLRHDLQKFLGLKTAFPGDGIPKVRPTRKEIQENPLNVSRIDICDEAYLPVRTELMYISRNASKWLRNHFLLSDGVFVSSREHLVEILGGWMHDPCQRRN